jgi:predicted GIY-YIG superfamily endonuclease
MAKVVVANTKRDESYSAQKYCIICLENKFGSCQLQEVVYQITCKYGEFYIGETSRPLWKRVSEHLRAFKNPNAPSYKNIASTELSQEEQARLSKEIAAFSMKNKPTFTSFTLLGWAQGHLAHSGLCLSKPIVGPFARWPPTSDHIWARGGSIHPHVAAGGQISANFC